MPRVDFDAEAARIKAGIEAELADAGDDSASVHRLIESSIKDWKAAVSAKLARDTPFADIELQMAKYAKVNPLHALYEPLELINKFELFCLENHEPFDKSFWLEHLAKPLAKPLSTESSGTESSGVGSSADANADSSSIGATAEDGHARAETLEAARVTHVLLLIEWKKVLDRVAEQRDLHKVSEMRKEFMDELKDWLKVVKSLSKSLKKFGLEAGVWLDIKGGSLSESQLDQLQQWSEFLEKDEGARSIAELLGRIRQMSSSERIETIKQSIATTEPVIDRTAKEEIIGTHLGQDIEHVLPHELALLSDPETTHLFDLKFIESRLLSFQMQGEILEPRQEDIEVERPVDEQNKLGPMILCIDTSGSMQGQPEEIAKAMALFLSSKAKEQGRACYLINFSNELSTFDLSGSEGLSSLISFLSQSFHGGTDVGPALDEALRMMATADYEKADVLVISDFVMGDLPEEVLVAIESQRKQGNRFNSLAIGNDLSSELATDFDKEWIYNPDTRAISVLAANRPVKPRQKYVETMILD